MTNLIVSFDGTWQRPDQKYPTNIGRLYSRLVQDDEQYVFYQSGVGSDWHKLTGGAMGWGIRESLKKALVWLATVYRPGNKIFIDGFSRGGMTARYLVAVIDAAGLPRNTSAKELKRVWEVYTKGLPSNHERVPIEFLGMFDCVGSHWPAFKNLTVSEDVKQVVHIVARNEMRKDFKVVLVEPDPRRVVQVVYDGYHSDIGGGGHVPGFIEDSTLNFMQSRMVAAGARFKLSRIRTVAYSPEYMKLHPPASWWRIRGNQKRIFPIGWVT